MYDTPFYSFSYKRGFKGSILPAGRQGLRIPVEKLGRKVKILYILNFSIEPLNPGLLGPFNFSRTAAAKSGNITS